MTRLIDADALKKSFDEHVYLVHHGFNETEYGCTQYGIHQIIDEQPTVDAVQVIRCKDCYFYGTFQRKHYCTKYEHSVKRDGFCAWAELKESEQ